MDGSGSGGGGGGGGGWGDSQPTLSGVYWVGTDGKVWVSGSQGTNSAGVYDTNSDRYWSNLGYSRINDPVNTEYGGSSGGGATYSGGGSGGGGAAAPAYDPNQLAALDYQIGRTQSQLGRADTLLSQGLLTLDDNYNMETGKANKDRTRVMEDYGTQRTDTKMAKGRALGNVNNNARTLADSVRRILGLASGAGSSAYKYTAPGAVARTASTQRSGVLNNYGINERNLKTAEDRATADFEELLSGLKDQRTQREGKLRSDTETTKIGINQTLADLAAKRAALLGGGWQATQAAIQPYMNDIDTRTAALDSIFNQFRTPYSVKAVNPQQVSLRDYTVDRAALQTGGAGGKGNYQPYSYFLNRQNNDQNLLA